MDNYQNIFLTLLHSNTNATASHARLSRLTFLESLEHLLVVKPLLQTLHRRTDESAMYNLPPHRSRQASRTPCLDGGQALFAVALLDADVHIVLGRPGVVVFGVVRKGICGAR